MTAPTTSATPKITLDQRAPSRHDKAASSGPLCSLTVWRVALRHLRRHLLEREQARKVLAWFLSSRSWGRRPGGAAQSQSAHGGVRLLWRLPLSPRSGAQARRELQDRISRTGSLVERHRRENEVGVAWPSTSHRGHRGSARRTSRWSPS